MTDAERHRILVEWNNTAVDYPLHAPLHQLIQNQVARTPEATALVYESVQLTYRNLNTRANQLAHYLISQGVGPDVLVGVCAERSIEMVVALLGILKAGGAYVPLDPEYPKERLAMMVQDAKPPVLLTQAHLLDRLPDSDAAVLCLDRDWKKLESQSTTDPEVTVNGTNLAYAIYTSGSTGKPKGVLNVHAGIVNRLLWMQDEYRLTPADRVLQKTPYSFDVSVWEFFWPLLAGATLVMARPEGHKDPAYLVKTIVEQDITTLHFVPSMLSIFLEAEAVERCQTLRLVFASGEALAFELQQRFFQRLRANLHNLYGPTEAAVDVTYWACRRDVKQTIVPIGRPIANTQIYILSEDLQPVGIAVAGELHIGGIGLARGYLNRPDLTEQKFIPNPFSQDPGARLYKTGDLARFLPDGNIEYLGRIDNQVKLRGFRIELGEIEAAIDQQTGVLQAVVTMEGETPEEKHLVAFIVPRAGHTLNLDAMREQLRKRLPEFMVPSRLVLLEKFPMTTSGKVDRKALRDPGPGRNNGSPCVPPRDELEALLVSLFQDTLGLPSVGITDNFFDLGGQSLLAARLLGRVEKATGRSIPPSALIQSATVEALASLVRDGSGNSHDAVAVALQTGTLNPPLFTVAIPGVETLGYALLARHMGSERAVFKLQGSNPVVIGRPFTPDELTRMAGEYIDAMRAIQPEGPYCFIAMCEGVQVVQEMVLQLERQGQEIGFFAILDTWVLENSQIQWRWRLNYYRKRLLALRGMRLSDRIPVLKKAILTNLQAEPPAIASNWRRAYWPGKDFKPPRFRAPVLLFRRPKQQFHYIDDTKMGWGERSLHGVEIHMVDFHHQEMLREPYLQPIAEVLKDHLQRLGKGGNNICDVAHERIVEWMA